MTTNKKRVYKLVQTKPEPAVSVSDASETVEGTQTCNNLSHSATALQEAYQHGFTAANETVQNEHVTFWEITPSIYNPDHNMVTFYVNNTPVTHMEINPTTTSELLYLLNKEMVDSSPETETETLSDRWFIKTPEIGDKTPILHLTSTGTIVDSLPLTKPFLQKLVPQLLKLYDPRPKEKPIQTWFKTHKKLTTTLLVIVGLMFLYATVTYFI